MKKNLTTAVLAGILAVGVTAFATPNTFAADTTTSVNTVATTTQVPQAPQTPKRTSQSMVLNMQEVAAIFIQKYPNSAVHSVTLKTDKRQFAYEVVGYTLKNTYTTSIDCITGKITKETKSGKERNLAQKIFNPTQVISQQQAQALAAKAVGEDAVAKGWSITADKGEVMYYVDVIQNDKPITVVLNAKDGSVLGQSATEDPNTTAKDKAKNKKK